MKITLLLVTAFIISGNTFASVACEKKLVEHFKKLDMNPNVMRDTNDYSNPRLEALGKKAYSTTSIDELNKLIEEGKKYDVKDSRANEAIRVCSAISAFAKAGVPSKDIELKTLDFQNGWSESMREPLAGLIKEEVDAIEKDKFKKMASSDAAFCSPDTNESHCSTPDGRVYKLESNVNQLQRGLAKEVVQPTSVHSGAVGSGVQK